MTRRAIATIATTSIAVATVAVALAVPVAQGPSPAPRAAPSTGRAGAVPRMADGHPDLSGVWWGGGDVGGPGFGAAGRAAGAARGTPPPTIHSL